VRPPEIIESIGVARIQREQFVKQCDGFVRSLLGEQNARQKKQGLLVRRVSLQLASEVGGGFIQTAEFQIRLAQLEMRQRQSGIKLNCQFVFLDGFGDMYERVRPTRI